MNIKIFPLIVLCLVFFLGYPVAADTNDTFGITVQAIFGLPVVITNDSANVEETTATLNGFLVDDSGFVCQYRFQYDIDTGVPYTISTVWAGAINTGQTFSQGISLLTKGELYFFRAQCQNINGINSGGEKTFLTKPDGPSNFQAERNLDFVQIDLTWTKGNGADRTVIVRKQDSYPLNRADGTVVFNGTANNYDDVGVTAGNHYYYRAWSYCSEGGLHQYSDDYDEDNAVALTPAQFDLRLISVLDNVVPTLVISVVVENRGDVAADITVSWVLSRVDNSVVLDMGSDTFEVLATSEKMYIVNPTTSYTGSVDITFVGNGLTASKIFSTEAAPAGGGGLPPRPRPPEVVPTPPTVAPAVIEIPVVLLLFFVGVCILLFFLILLIRRIEEEEKA